MNMLPRVFTKRLTNRFPDFVYLKSFQRWLNMGLFQIYDQAVAFSFSLNIYAILEHDATPIWRVTIPK